jgi:predicted Zn-dependent protease
MGHEIVHIKGRHIGARRARRDFSPESSEHGPLGAQHSGASAESSARRAATRQAAFSRQLEMESYTLGARYMAAAGYDPKGTIAFLKTLDQERALNPIDVPAYIMSHPITQERVANAELVVKSLGATQPRPDDPRL